MNDDEFVAAFESCELPNEQFHHRDHLRLALIYLRRYGYAGARVRIPEAIRAYAAHHGAPGKYHATITIAWLRLVELAAKGCGAQDIFVAFPILLQKDALEKCYSLEVLWSEAARVVFIEPDLMPLGSLVSGAAGGPRADEGVRRPSLVAEAD